MFSGRRDTIPAACERAAIDWLLETQAESKGKTDPLPTVTSEELARERRDEPVVLELREFDLDSEEGIDNLCDMFLRPPWRRGLDLFRHGKTRVPDASGARWAAPVYRETLSEGRNDPCPCGSRHKYKKCCGR